jgi:hypothetical protein
MALNISKIIDDINKHTSAIDKNSDVINENENQDVSPEEELELTIQNLSSEIADRTWGPSLSAGIGAVTAIENVRRTLK